MRFTSLLAGLGLALSIHAPARAEIFDMDGQFPAPFRDVSLARSIGIDRIGGRDGMALSLAIEQQLGRRGPDGRLGAHSSARCEGCRPPRATRA